MAIKGAGGTQAQIIPCARPEKDATRGDVIGDLCARQTMSSSIEKFHEVSICEPARYGVLGV